MFEKAIDDTQNRVEEGIFRPEEGGVVISKDVDSGVDFCPHDWEYLKEEHEIQVFRCKRGGCLWFRVKYRTALDKFIQFFRRLPKIPVKLPTHGYYSDEEFDRKFGIDPRIARKYFEVLEGLDINGSPAYFEADSTVFYYRDDPGTINSLWDRYKGWIGFFAGVLTTATIGYVIHKRKHG